MAQKRPPDDKAQAGRFVETAKAAEADESGRLFQQAIRKVIPKKKRHKKADS